jgi:hypothetical protein
VGYDMHWRKVDPSEEAAVAAARAVWDVTIAERNALNSEKGMFNHEKAKALGDWDSHDVYDGRTERYKRAYDKAHAAYMAMSDAENSYFRLNITGMGIWRGLMGELGMIFDAGELPEWPKIEAYGVTWDDVERVEDPGFCADKPALDEETAERAGRYIAERDELLAWHGPEVPGIPVHKFGSNDGWVVLPAECQAALAIYMAKLEEVGQDSMGNLIENMAGPWARGRWAQWLAYLNGAVTHDGFEVH